MVHLTLEIASAAKAERYDESKSDACEPIASSQAEDEVTAKAAMLENILEALNDESLLPTNEWLRLTYRDKNLKFVKRETF